MSQTWVGGCVDESVRKRRAGAEERIRDGAGIRDEPLCASTSRAIMSTWWARDLASHMLAGSRFLEVRAVYMLTSEWNQAALILPLRLTATSS